MSYYTLKHVLSRNRKEKRQAVVCFGSFLLFGGVVKKATHKKKTGYYLWYLEMSYNKHQQVLTECLFNLNFCLVLKFYCPQVGAVDSPPVFDMIKRSDLEGIKNYVGGNGSLNAKNQVGISPNQMILHTKLLMDDLHIAQDGESLLIQAAKENAFDVLKFLVTAAGVEINARSKVDKFMPSNINEVQVKISYRNITTQTGMTALMFAAKNGNCEMVKCLIQQGHADPNLQKPKVQKSYHCKREAIIMMILLFSPTQDDVTFQSIEVSDTREAPSYKSKM